MKRRGIVLGAHAFTRGIGWIVFERPFVPVDWGVIERKQDRNTQCLFAVERILERYRPDVIVLEADKPARAPRIRRLCRSIQSLARGRGIEECVYSRSDVAMAVVGSAQASRFEVAVAIAQRVDAIRSRLPKRRPAWESERPNMALFNAAAIVLTHYAVVEGLQLR